jgi:hypothetical protein
MFVPKAILKGQLQKATFFMSVLIFALAILKDVKLELVDRLEMVLLSMCPTVCLFLAARVIVWQESILLRRSKYMASRT